MRNDRLGRWNNGAFGKFSVLAEDAYIYAHYSKRKVESLLFFYAAIGTYMRKNKYTTGRRACYNCGGPMWTRRKKQMEWRETRGNAYGRLSAIIQWPDGAVVSG